MKKITLEDGCDFQFRSSSSIKKYITSLILSSFFLLLFTTRVAAQLPNPGPGFGNLEYTSQELFKVISRVDDSNGIPPGTVPTQYGNRLHGTNLMVMVNGYGIAVFAPDGGDGVGGFVAYDLSNPRNITLAKQVYNSQTSDFREAHSIGLSSQGSGSILAIQTRFGIELWDWADVNNPVRVSKLSIPGVNSGDYGNVSWQLYWQAPYLYVARGNAGITIINTTNTSAPFIVKTIPNSQLAGFNTNVIFAMGNQMFISSAQTTAGMALLDISDPEDPRLKSKLSSLPFYYATCWDGKTAGVSVRNAGARMVTYDTTSNNQFNLLNNTHQVDDMLYCSFQDNYIYQGSQDFISKIDITNPSNYNTLGTGNLALGAGNDHGQVFAFGNTVWIGNDHGHGSGFIVHQKERDTSPPVVKATSPQDGDVNQALTSRIGVGFSDNLLIESLTAETFSVRKRGDSNNLPGTYSLALGVANFHPTSPLQSNTVYEVTINGIQDTVGNPMTESHTFAFSTGASIGFSVEAESDGPSPRGHSVNFTGTATSGTSTQYSWNFGDGTASTEFSFNSIISHTYENPGHYSVTLTAKQGSNEATASLTQTIHNPLTEKSPTSSRTITFDNNRIFNVNIDNNTVTAISAISNVKLWEVAVGERPRTLAIAPDGRVWVINQDNASISVLNPTNGSLITTHTLPRGSAPYGIAFSPDGSNVYVTLEALGKFLKLDSNGNILSEAQLNQSIRGIAITEDSSTAYVTRFISARDHGEVFEINLSDMSSSIIELQMDTTTTDASAESQGVPNYVGSISISPDGLKAWIPSNKTNTNRGSFLSGQGLTFESTVRAIASQIDLTSGLEIFSEQLDFDDNSQPKFIEFSSLGDYVFTAIEGTNLIDVRDAYTQTRVNEIQNTGFGVRGIAFNADRSKLFAHNFISRSVEIYDTSDITGTISRIAVVDTVANEVLHSRVLKGKKIFYNAADARMSLDGYLSCASCHTDGNSDDRIWDFTDRGEGLRNTISLLGRHGMGNGRVHWTANFDEIQDFENDIRFGFGGTGFLTDADFAATEAPLGTPKAGLSANLDNLAFFVQSNNEFPISPYRNQDGTLTANAVAGQSLFNNSGCASCHSGDFFSDNKRHDVGTIEASSGQGHNTDLEGIGFDTPTLIGIWKNPPYLHNGQAETLNDVLTNTVHMGTSFNSTEKAQLISFLKQIEYEGDPIIIPDPEDQTRYVKLIANSEVNGNPWTSMAELNVLEDGVAISQSGWSVTVDSEETNSENGAGSNAIDGDTHTIWHTQYSNSTDPMPHEIVISLGDSYSVNGFRYLPRQSGTNGRIADYQFFISGDGSTWSEVASGTFSAGQAEKEVIFETDSTAIPAVISNPVNGTMLTSNTQTFSWNGSNNDAYSLYVGSSFGANDIFDSGQLDSSASSSTVSNLPTDGSTLYVRMRSQVNGIWTSNDTSYTAFSDTSQTPELTSPVPGTNLSGTTETFSWTGSADFFWFYAGSTPGAQDYYRNDSAISSSSRVHTITNLPSDGSTVYVRFWYNRDGGWKSVDYTYIASSPIDDSPKVISPAPDSSLTGSSQIFSWSGNASQFWFYAGSRQGGSEYYRNTSAIPSTESSHRLTNLPINGTTVYIRFWYFEESWQYIDYTYTAKQNSL